MEMADTEFNGELPGEDFLEHYLEFGGSEKGGKEVGKIQVMSQSLYIICHAVSFSYHLSYFEVFVDGGALCGHIKCCALM